MQDIYNYIRGIHHVGMAYVTAILWLQFMVHVMLFPVINVLSFHINRPTLRSMCVVSSMAVFYSYLISCFPDMFLRYFLID